MLDLVEIVHRCETGLKMTEQDFDINNVFMTLKSLARDHEIKYNPQDPVPSDDALVERVFNASVDFLEKVGGYCPDTGRVVRFSRQEILGATKGYRECRVGCGADEKVWKSRLPEAQDRPWCHVGSGIVNSSMELASLMIENYARIERTDSIAIPAFNRYHGVEFQPKSPLEIAGVMQNTRFAREAVIRAGRPGMPILNGVPTSGSPQATIASAGPGSGMGTSDGWFMPVYAEMKIPFETLTKAAFFNEIGANLGTPSSAMIGGYVGGPEGMAIASVAYIMLSHLAFGTNYHTNFPVTLMETISSTRGGLWALSVSNQAMARFTEMPVFNIGYMANGPATLNYYREAAAYVLVSIASGCVSQTPFPAKGVLADGILPLDAEFHVKLLDASVKFKRQQASETVLKLLSLFEESLLTPEKGRSYLQCYDQTRHEPDEELKRLYDQVLVEMAGLGFDLI